MMASLRLLKPWLSWRVSPVLYACNGVRFASLGEDATAPTDSSPFVRGILGSYENGTKQWNAMRAKAEPQNVAALRDRVAIVLEMNRLTRSSNLTKIFDNVLSPEDLDDAEEALERFRRSRSKPRESLPMVVVRACVRVGQPQRALHVIKNKKLFGVFPSANVYNVLMDSFFTSGDTEGLLDTYQDLLLQEVRPNATTCMLAALGHASLGTEDGFRQAKSLCLHSWRLNPKTGSRAFSYAARQLTNKEQKEHAKELMLLLNEQGPPLSKHDLRSRLLALTSIGDLDSALVLLESVPSELTLGLESSEAYQRLHSAVEESSDDSMAARLKRTIENHHLH